MAQERQLTSRIRDILNFVRVFTRRNGFPPSMTEAGDALGIHRTCALRLAQRAVRAGAMTHIPGSARSWRVVRSGRAANR
jgi:hypothetical protein